MKKTSQMVVKIPPPRSPFAVSDSDLAAVKRHWENSAKEINACILEIDPEMTPPELALQYNILASTALAVPIAEELVWPEFWALVAEWLAKQGIRIGGIALLDGPLPIGDLIALGLSICLIWALIQIWDQLWEQAALISASKQAIKVIDGLLEEALRHADKIASGPPPQGDNWESVRREIIAFLKRAKNLLERVVNKAERERIQKAIEDTLKKANMSPSDLN